MQITKKKMFKSLKKNVEDISKIKQGRKRQVTNNIKINETVVKKKWGKAIKQINFQLCINIRIELEEYGFFFKAQN